MFNSKLLTFDFESTFFIFFNQFKPDRKWLYLFQWLKFSPSHVCWLFLSNSSVAQHYSYESIMNYMSCCNLQSLLFWLRQPYLYISFYIHKDMTESRNLNGWKLHTQNRRAQKTFWYRNPARSKSETNFLEGELSYC